MTSEDLAPKRGWIGFDLDGTLAEYDGVHHVGEPYPETLALLKALLAGGWEIKIVTARANPWPRREFALEQIQMIQDWLRQVGLPPLEITYSKDMNMAALFDDRAYGVREGRVCPACDHTKITGTI